MEAALQLRRLLLEGIAGRSQSRQHVETADFDLAARRLLARIDQTPTPEELVLIGNEALKAAESYAQRLSEHFREQNKYLQSMVSMLTNTVADISGQSEASIARLRTIEQEIEKACEIPNFRALKDSLAVCLASVKEAAREEKKATLSTIERLRDHIKSAPQAQSDPPAPTTLEQQEPAFMPMEVEYVGIFKLQRTAHIQKRFGAHAVERMLALLEEDLKRIQGAQDRLVRWKEGSLVMFLTSSESLAEIRQRLSEVVDKIRRRYIEIGNAALLAIGIDWIVFSQAECSSPYRVFAEVDTFLSKGPGGMFKDSRPAMISGSSWSYAAR